MVAVLAARSKCLRDSEPGVEGDASYGLAKSPGMTTLR